jgi:hypothetical protein
VREPLEQDTDFPGVEDAPLAKLPEIEQRIRE